jgi:acyl carrier protein
VATEAEIYEGLTEVFHEVFGDDSLRLTPTLSAEQVPDWDSVRMLNLVLAIEQRFEVRLRSRDVDQLKNVGDMVRLLESKIA